MQQILENTAVKIFSKSLEHFGKYEYLPSQSIILFDPDFLISKKKFEISPLIKTLVKSTKTVLELGLKQVSSKMKCLKSF